MLSIICGEDNVASREFLISLQEKYRGENYEIKNITLDDLKTLGESDQSINLFGFKQIFVMENLGRSLSRRKNTDLFVLLTKIDQNKQIILLDWEDSVAGRDLKTGKLGTIKEFKPAQNVFKLLEACYPHNLSHFLGVLGSVTTPRSEMFVYLMLVRHVRALVLGLEGKFSTRIQPWQKQRIMRQIEQWNKQKLIAFYQKLLGLDISLKSGKNIFGLKKSIELLSCYYIS